MIIHGEVEIDSLGIPKLDSTTAAFPSLSFLQLLRLLQIGWTPLDVEELFPKKVVTTQHTTFSCALANALS